MSGKWISIERPRGARAFAVSVASWAMAMARTMDSPRPWWSSTRAVESLEGLGRLGVDDHGAVADDEQPVGDGLDLGEEVRGQHGGEWAHLLTATLLWLGVIAERLRRSEERFSLVLGDEAWRRVGREIMRLRAALTAYKQRAELQRHPRRAGRRFVRSADVASGDDELVAHE
jgi:hypothetical protein